LRKKRERGSVGTISPGVVFRPNVKLGDGTVIHSVGVECSPDVEVVVTYQPSDTCLNNNFPLSSCPQQKEQDMHTAYNIESDATIAQTTIDQDTKKAKKRLEERLFDLKSEKIKDMEKHFHMTYDRPTTLKDLKEALAKGHYTLDCEEYDDDYEFGSTSSILYAIKWKNPNHKPNTKGYRAAASKLDEAYQATKDKIYCLTPEQGLEAFNSFKGQTFH
jgi:hypothetical protein